MKKELLNKVCGIIVSDYESEKRMKEYWERKYGDLFIAHDELKKENEALQGQIDAMREKIESMIEGVSE